MTAQKDVQNDVKQDLQRYVSFKEVRRGNPLPDRLRTDEQIRADMKASVRRNASTLKTLAKL